MKGLIDVKPKVERIYQAMQYTGENMYDIYRLFRKHDIKFMELEPSYKTDLSGHYNLLKCNSCKHIVTQLECLSIEKRVNKEIARRTGNLSAYILKEMNNNG